MSDFVNKIVVLQDGKLTKVGPTDNLSIGGSFTAGTLVGDGASVTNIAEGNVVGLTGALSTLTTDVGTANTNASAAVSTANAAATDAAAALVAAGNAETAATAAQGSAASSASDAASAASSATSSAGSASSAASDASAAAASALAAQGDASSASSSATAAAGSASTAASDASAAAGSASAAASDASTAQSAASASAASASTAATDAGNAAASASSAASDASAAAGSASSAAASAAASAADVLTAQGAATASAASAATAATDASNAAASALSAQGDASSAVTSASNAAASAVNAEASAYDSAQSASNASASAASAAGDASAAVSSAASAASDAASAATDAASAISTANGAVTTADAAASDAAAAVSTANSAASDASSALTLAQAALPASGGTISGDLSVTGDLTVQGNIVSKGQIDVIISDSFLDLNAGNVGSSATAGGFTVNVKKATGFTAETATSFVAGVAGVSAPSMTISGSALAAGDIIQVSNSAGGKNDGIYVVAGKVGSVVSIKGVGGTMPSAQVPFVQNQLIDGSGETALVVKVDLAAFAVSNGALYSASGVIAAGLLCYAYVANATEGGFSGHWSVLASTASSTLQTAYDNGDGALVLGSDKPLHVSGSSDVQLDPRVQIGSSIGFMKSVAAGVAKGDILFLDTDGVCKKASSALYSKALYVALENNNAVGAVTASKKVDFLGEVYVGIVDAAPSITNTLFLSATAGKASKVAPVSGTIIELGAVVGAAVGGLYPVQWSVQTIAVL